MIRYSYGYTLLKLFSRILHVNLCYKRTRTMPKKAFTRVSLVHTSTSSLSLLDNFWFTCSRIVQVFLINCSFSWVGIGAQPDLKLLSSWDLSFLSFSIPTLVYSPLRPKQCLHKLSQSSWENNRTHCIHQLYSTHATLTQLDQNFHLCTSPLMTDSVTVHIWKRKECLQNRLHSVAFFSHPQRSLWHWKRGCAAASGAES